ncbi:hypothetical protein BpHYR1_016343 [Brachionus plicatilis]|uniref:Uncharacterized protein n=1 Tax=Brachionus plicatilis TaxID=10195 RepID=A0A3M7QXW5_BRAPC|nr:hypothetical protein BpHYR1_016343 [Brachionus plicatilis]
MKIISYNFAKPSVEILLKHQRTSTPFLYLKASIYFISTTNIKYQITNVSNAIFQIKYKAVLSMNFKTENQQICSPIC